MKLYENGGIIWSVDISTLSPTKNQFHSCLTQKSKIRNEKIARWRIELSCYSLNVSYRPGKENAAVDTLSRVCGLTTSSSATLVKATQPFERLNLDFKGPLPSKTQNKYMLTIIDEYSRFPFIIPCPDVTATTVIQGLCSLFAILGVPASIHTDWGAAFMSEDLKSFLHARRVAVSCTSPYNPQGNGLCEQYNGIIWKTVQLALANWKMLISKWESVIPEALNAIRTLLCTSTNSTPHERFFSFPRWNSTGTFLPSWLAQPGIVLLKHHVHHSKHDPIVSKVKLIEANPNTPRLKLLKEGSQWSP